MSNYGCLTKSKGLCAVVLRRVLVFAVELERVVQVVGRRTQVVPITKFSIHQGTYYCESPSYAVLSHTQSYAYFYIQHKFSLDKYLISLQLLKFTINFLY